MVKAAKRNIKATLESWTNIDSKGSNTVMNFIKSENTGYTYVDPKKGKMNSLSLSLSLSLKAHFSLIEIFTRGWIIYT